MSKTEKSRRKVDFEGDFAHRPDAPTQKFTPDRSTVVESRDLDFFFRHFFRSKTQKIGSPRVIRTRRIPMPGPRPPCQAHKSKNHAPRNKNHAPTNAPPLGGPRGPQGGPKGTLLGASQGGPMGFGGWRGAETLGAQGGPQRGPWGQNSPGNPPPRRPDGLQNGCQNQLFVSIPPFLTFLDPRF